MGLLPNNKTLELLDYALSADAVHTVRTMREVLISGVEPLSLVSQLGALITDILAGSFDLHQEARKEGFFNRNLCECPSVSSAICILSHVLHLMNFSDESSGCILVLINSEVSPCSCQAGTSPAPRSAENSFGSREAAARVDGSGNMADSCASTVRSRSVVSSFRN